MSRKMNELNYVWVVEGPVAETGMTRQWGSLNPCGLFHQCRLLWFCHPAHRAPETLGSKACVLHASLTSLFRPNATASREYQKVLPLPWLARMDLRLLFYSLHCQAHIWKYKFIPVVVVVFIHGQGRQNRARPSIHGCFFGLTHLEHWSSILGHLHSCSL